MQENLGKQQHGDWQLSQLNDEAVLTNPERASRSLPVLILVMGLPASGKTVLSEKLATHTRLPLLAKDGIKERLFDNLGSGNREWSMKLGVTTYRIMDYLIEEQLKAGNSLIVESTFHPQYDTAKMQAWQKRYSFQCVQILCHAQGEILLERFRKREQSTERHPGQDKIEDMPGFEEKLLKGKDETLDLQGVTIELDTTNFDEINEAIVFERVINFIDRS